MGRRKWSNGALYEHRDCPVTALRDRHWRWLQQHVHWAAGRAWYPGTVGQWPARYVAAMQLLDNEIAALREERMQGK